MNIKLSSGKQTQEVAVPDGNLIAVFAGETASDRSGVEATLIEEAIENPIGEGRLERELSSRSKVAIVVDDATRSTPTRIILTALLGKLRSLGLPPQNITITVATGLHRRPSDRELLTILGISVLENYDVGWNDARNNADFVHVGTTSRGTPVHINRRVASADIVLACGIIKSHAFAGFTGGAKSIVPGVAGRDTILSNHRFEFVQYPNGLLGDADRSLVRQDLEEAARLLPVFIVNVVMDRQGALVAAVAGDLIRAHRRGVEHFLRIAERTISAQPDIVVIEGGYSARLHFYQALGSIDCVASTPRPVLRGNGLAILFAECADGMGSEIFREAFTDDRSPQDVLRILRNSQPRDDQWAVQRLASFLSQFDLAVVSSGAGRKDLSSMKIEHYDTLQQALGSGLERYGSDASVLVVKDPDYVVPRLREGIGSPSR